MSFCTVVEPVDPFNDCDAPPTYRVGSGYFEAPAAEGRIRTSCFACGKFVCTRCSRKVRHHKKICRLCTYCLIENKYLELGKVLVVGEPKNK